jgi:hypothetical protein
MPRMVRQPFQALTGCTSDWWGPRGFRLTESRTRVAKGDERPPRPAADSSTATSGDGEYSDLFQ